MLGNGSTHESEKSVLEVELAFYERERDRLAEQHPGEYLLIYGDSLIGHYETQGVAAAEGTRRYGSGPFLVRLAGEGTPVFTSTASYVE